jgi:hypothetical protein
MFGGLIQQMPEVITNWTSQKYRRLGILLMTGINRGNYIFQLGKRIRTNTSNLLMTRCHT